MKRFAIKIEGDTPLLQNRFVEGKEADKGHRTVHIETKDPREIAEASAYRSPEGFLYFPITWILRNISESGSNHKQKGSRKSLKYVIPGAVRGVSDIVPLLNGDGKTKATKCEVDARPVTIPATKGRVMRYRARVNQWSAAFELMINEKRIDPGTIHMLLNEGGEECGLGDYRPQKGGPFGTFRVVHFAEAK
jgi:hypothetical protein